MKEILPIGTVVKLKDNESVLLMITGYFPEDDDKVKKEYMESGLGCLFRLCTNLLF